MPMEAITEHGELCESLLRGPKPGEFGTLATVATNMEINVMTRTEGCQFKTEGREPVKAAC